jgi:hypothetical protein
MQVFVKNPKRFPEIFVERDFLTTRDDIVYRVIKVQENTYKVLLEHPVLGKTLEVFELDTEDQTLCLKSVFPSEMQTKEEMEVALDYYNNFLLDGENTYMDYYNKEVGYFLLSRNVGVFPTSTVNEE